MTTPAGESHGAAALMNGSGELVTRNPIFKRSATAGDTPHLLSIDGETKPNHKITKLDIQIYEDIVERMGKDLDIRTRKAKFKTYHACFLGFEAVDWMLLHLTFTVRGRDEAVEFGQRLVDAGFIFCINCNSFKDKSNFYQFARDASRSPSVSSDGVQAQWIDIAKEAHSQFEAANVLDKKKGKATREGGEVVHTMPSVVRDRGSMSDEKFDLGRSKSEELARLNELEAGGSLKIREKVSFSISSEDGANGEDETEEKGGSLREKRGKHTRTSSATIAFNVDQIDKKKTETEEVKIRLSDEKVGKPKKDTTNKIDHSAAKALRKSIETTKTNKQGKKDKKDHKKKSPPERVFIIPSVIKDIKAHVIESDENKGPQRKGKQKEHKEKDKDKKENKDNKEKEKKKGFLALSKGKEQEDHLLHKMRKQSKSNRELKAHREDTLTRDEPQVFYVPPIINQKEARGLKHSDEKGLITPPPISPRIIEESPPPKSTSAGAVLDPAAEAKRRAFARLSTTSYSFLYGAGVLDFDDLVCRMFAPVLNEFELIPPEERGKEQITTGGPRWRRKGVVSSRGDSSEISTRIGVSVKDRKWRLHTYKCCFVGSECVDWLAQELGVARTVAVIIGGRLMSMQYFHHVTHSKAFTDSYALYTLTTEESMCGHLLVNVISAHNLHFKQGAQNLYHCEVSMKTGKKKQELVTKRVECSAPNPEWNDQVKFIIPDAEEELKLDVRVLHTRTTSKQTIKVVTYDTSLELKSNHAQKAQTYWLRLTKSSAQHKMNPIIKATHKAAKEIFLSVQYIAYDDLHVYNELEQLLCREFHVVKAIFDSLTGKPGGSDPTNESSIASALIDIFNWNSQVVPLLQYAIHTEVQKTKQESLLFRHDSFANRLLSEFSILVGSDFVQRSLRFLMKEILEKDYEVEIDPTKVEGPTKLDDNRARLLDVTVRFLDFLIESESYIPLAFREISQFLYEEAELKYPEAKYKVIGGFIFLRWICPAIVSPQEHGLVERALKPNETRRLILVAKLLQGLSNEVEFDDKESYMTSCNRFCRANITKMRALFDKILITDSCKAKRTEAHKKKSHFEALASYMIKNQEAIIEEMLKTSAEELDRTSLTRLIINFRQVLQQLEKSMKEKVQPAKV